MPQHACTERWTTWKHNASGGPQNGQQRHDKNNNQQMRETEVKKQLSNAINSLTHPECARATVVSSIVEHALGSQSKPAVLAEATWRVINRQQILYEVGPGRAWGPAHWLLQNADTPSRKILHRILSTTQHQVSTLHGHTHTHTRLTALCPGLPRWAGTRKTVSGSGISWAIWKSAPCSRQITMPTPHHSVFYRPDALPAAQPTASKHWRLHIALTTIKLI